MLRSALTSKNFATINSNLAQRVAVILLVLCFIGLLRTPAAELRPTAKDLSALEVKLEKLRQRWNVPGMAAGIARGGAIIWTKEFGLADRQTQRPVTPDS